MLYGEKNDSVELITLEYTPNAGDLNSPFALATSHLKQ